MNSVVQVVARRAGARGAVGADGTQATTPIMTTLWATGIVMDAEGRVLVCADAAQPDDSLELRLANGDRRSARFLAQQVRVGLALLQASDAEGLVPVRWRADAPPVHQGDWLVVYAYSQLDGKPTLTLAHAESPDTLHNGEPAPFLRLAVPTVKGSCGGAVLDGAGRFRGMAVDVEVLQDAGPLYGGVPEPLACALDRDRLQVLSGGPLQGLLARLKGEHERRVGFLGIMVGPDDPTSPVEGREGTPLPVRVLSVLAGSPADRAGFGTEDRILSVDGRPTNSVGDLRQRIALSPPGTMMHFGLESGGRPRSTSVRMGDRSMLDWMDRQRRLNRRIRTRLEESRSIGQLYLPLIDAAIARFE